VLSGALLELCRGESADLAFESRGDVTLTECLAMAERKTGALLGAACQLGALAGGADSRAAELYRTFGRQLGVAFQLVDDVLGIWGDPATTGKPAGNDLAARKKSLPVVAALTSGRQAACHLARLYQREDAFDEAAVAHAAELVEMAGGRAWALAEAERRIEAAREALARARPEPNAEADLHVLADLITGATTDQPPHQEHSKCQTPVTRRPPAITPTSSTSTGPSPKRATCSNSAIHRMGRAYWMGHTADLRPVEEVIAIIRSSTVPMAVASANDTQVVHAGLAALGLGQAFGAVVGRDDVTRPKPHADVYLTAAARLGVAASRCPAFDNTDDGVASALAAGMDVIDVRTWTMRKPESERNHAGPSSHRVRAGHPAERSLRQQATALAASLTRQPWG
jgi:hypothetical protein